MNERIKQLAEQAGFYFYDMHNVDGQDLGESIEADEWSAAEKFAELIVRECIDKIETHQIPVGNSAAGEMACEWTYAALKEIRDEIKEHFGVE
jgi:pyrrolidone-carboxylate peptidase